MEDIVMQRLFSSAIGLVCGLVLGILLARNFDGTTGQEYAARNSYAKNTASSSSLERPAREIYPELVIGYRDSIGQQFEFVYIPREKRVILRADVSKDSPSADMTLNRLKNEAFRLASSKDPVEIGRSGIRFKFTGGYPVWAPYQSLGPYCHDQCLLFAEDVTVENGVIRGSGTSKKPEYYPYPETANQQAPSTMPSI